MGQHDVEQKTPSAGVTVVDLSSPSDSEASSIREPKKTMFSIHSKTTKKLIVLAATMTAFISTVSAQIYLPAMDPMAREFGVSDQDIALTITTYMIFQGITPMFVTSLADTRGRRPAYLFCFVSYLAANIGLALAPTYASVLVLRCLQSIGSSSTSVLCNAVVADIITSAERGQYFAFTMIPMALGPSVGPTLGGVISQYLGWRAVFWCLTIYAAVVSITMSIFFPETCRSIVGDGSVMPAKFHRSGVQWLRLYQAKRDGSSDTIMKGNENTLEATKKTSILRSITATIVLLFKKESGLVLWSNGFGYITFYCIPTAMPFLLRDNYALTEGQLGLMYLPLAAGVILTALVSGRLFTWNYKRHAKKSNQSTDKDIQVDLSKFPMERSRLEIGAPLILLAGVCTMAWGWAMHVKGHIAIICVLNFLVGMGMSGSNNCLNLLLVDINQGRADRKSVV